MNRRIISGCVLSTTMLILLSIAPTIYADIDTISIDTKPDSDAYDYDGYTPIKLVFLLISKLINHKDIQMVDSVDDVEQLVEHDAELSGIFEELMSYSCGCEDSSSLEWNFPVICFLLCIPLAFSLLFNVLLYYTGIYSDPFGRIIDFIGESLNCPWADFWVVNTNST